MSATLFAPPVERLSKAPAQRRLEHAYPLFGFRREVLHVPRADRHQDIQTWLLSQDRAVPGESWSSRWARCQLERRSCFKDVWIVRLPKRSRSLQPGDYVFDPLTDFLHIPGSPPQVVEDCYQEAFTELPRHRFVYLDLLWDETPSGRTLVSVEKLRATLLQHERQFRKQLLTERALIEAARAKQREILEKLQPADGVARKIRLPSTPAEAQRILELPNEVLTRSLQVLIDTIEFIKFDPVIVFEEPALLERSGGHMPLGLIAHWD